MADKDIQRIFTQKGNNVSLFLNQWQTMTKEEKQEFIVKYIKSLTFERNDKYKNGIHLMDLKSKSLFTEKVDRLSELGLSQYYVKFISNSESVMINVSYPLKESQLKSYMKEFKDIDNPENINNKFKLGIITTTIKTIKSIHPYVHENIL